MPLFGSPKPLTAPRTPRRRLTPAEKLQLEQHQFLSTLRRSGSPDDRALYRRIMLDSLAPSKTDLERTIETLTALRGAGVNLLGGDGDGGGSMVQQAVRGIVQGLGSIPAVQQQFAGRVLMGPATPEQTAREQPTALPASSGSRAPRSTSRSNGNRPHPLLPYAEVPAGTSVSLRSRIAIGQLRGKTPEQAADLIVQQQPQLAEVLAGTPDDQLDELFDALVGQHPDLAGLVAWLWANAEWTHAVAAGLRAQLGVPEAAAADMQDPDDDGRRSVDL